MQESVARSVLWPTDSRVVVRVCFLYVGQGSSILVLVRDGANYRLLVIDCNLDVGAGGIDVPAMVKDLSPDGHLYAFVNTHPHDDHLRGVKRFGDELSVDSVWHSGHVPSRRYGSHHPELKALAADVERRNGTNAVWQLQGSRSQRQLFDATVHVLAPAEYVNDEVNEEEADARYRRIHENCAVFKIGKAPSWLLVTGDADLDAFREHITKYHGDRLQAFLLDASHHGSRSFFKANEEAEPYLDALKAINPKYVVISAPADGESRFDHPHADAVALYAQHVGAENVLHTGKDRESFIFDIFEDGSHGGPGSDSGRLAEVYGLDKGRDGGDDGGGEPDTSKAGPFVRPSAPGEFTPRKYGQNGVLPTE
jgi:competence protein ComEC